MIKSNQILNEKPALGCQPALRIHFQWMTYKLFLHEPYESLLCAWWGTFLTIFDCFSLFSNMQMLFKIHNSSPTFLFWIYSLFCQFLENQLTLNFAVVQFRYHYFVINFELQVQRHIIKSSLLLPLVGRCLNLVSLLLVANLFNERSCKKSYTVCPIHSPVQPYRSLRSCMVYHFIKVTRARSKIIECIWFRAEKGINLNNNNNTFFNVGLLRITKEGIFLTTIYDEYFSHHYSLDFYRSR